MYIREQISAYASFFKTYHTYSTQNLNITIIQLMMTFYLKNKDDL